MLYFLIPLYNESPNVPELAMSLREVLPGVPRHFVLVNDCSADDTEQAARKQFAGAEFTILNNERNSGPGYSFNQGFEWILQHSKSANDSVITLEGDNTCDLKILPQMLSLNREFGYDLVLASVYAQGGGFSHTTLLRKFLSATANLLLRLCFDIKVLTLTSFYRVYSISLLAAIKSKHQQIVTENGFICKLETLVKAIRCGASIIEVPMMLHSDKRIGKSKMKVFRTFRRYVAFLLWKKI